jgi:glycosyltransferase involved in cell wall biosynthesis
MNTMKFLMILPSTLRGGVEEYALKVTSAAVRAGWEVHVGFPNTPDTASLIREFTANGVHYHRLEIGECDRNKLEKALNHGVRLGRTLALLLKIKPTVVQMVLPWFDACLGSILACGLLQVPTVVRFGLVTEAIALSRWRIRLYAWARARNQQWLAISDNNRQLIGDAFEIPYGEVCRIYNGVTINASSTNKNHPEYSQFKQNIHRNLGIPDDAQLALTVGRLDQQKGYSDLIPTIPHLMQEFPRLKFVWVGEGNQRQQLQQQLYDYGVTDSVLMTGYRSDVPQLLQAADLFVFPTHYEGGQSFALAEAMAYGVPIVTSNASGIPEVIQHGVHGLLFRAKDSCALLEALRWALRRPEQMQAMAQQAQRHAQDFSEEKMLRETLDLLQSVGYQTQAQPRVKPLNSTREIST